MIECRQCHDVFVGDRASARRERWEPWSSSTQRELDHGAMVCPACVGAIIAGAIDALRRRPPVVGIAKPTDRR